MSSMTLIERLRCYAVDPELAGLTSDDLWEAADLLEQYEALIGEVAAYDNLPPLSEVITNLTPSSSPFMEMLNAAHSSGTGTPATPGSRGDTPRRDSLPGSDAGQGSGEPAERQAAHEGDHPGPDGGD